jgi:hypothetical protein
MVCQYEKCRAESRAGQGKRRVSYPYRYDGEDRDSKKRRRKGSVGGRAHIRIKNPRPSVQSMPTRGVAACFVPPARCLLATFSGINLLSVLAFEVLGQALLGSLVLSAIFQVRFLDVEAEPPVAVAAPDASAHETETRRSAQCTHELAMWWNLIRPFIARYPLYRCATHLWVPLFVCVLRTILCLRRLPFECQPIENRLAGIAANR